MMKRIAAAALSAVLLGSCTVVQSLRPPSITANPIPATFFLGNTPRVLGAVITAGGSGIVITRIELRINRDRDPARFTNDTPHVFTVASPLPQGGPVAITLPNSLTFAPAQLVTARWFVDYMLRSGGTDVATVSSTASTRQACTSAQIATFLTALQTNAVGRFPATLNAPTAPSTGIELLASRGFLPSHGFRSFIGQGVAFADVPRVIANVSVNTPVDPQLLLYAPNPATLVPSLNEPFVPDFPYTLIGFAFAAPYDPAGPPALGCMPREAWFVHEAGWHPSNGGFIPQAITEAAPGDSNPQEAPVILNPGDPRFGSVWHPRIWDIHLFIRTGVPMLSGCNPAPGVLPPPDFFAPGLLARCAAGFPQSPPTGSAFPPAGFFVRVLPP